MNTSETGPFALLKSDFHSEIQDPYVRCEQELKILVRVGDVSKPSKSFTGLRGRDLLGSFETNAKNGGSKHLF